MIATPTELDAAGNARVFFGAQGSVENSASAYGVTDDNVLKASAGVGAEARGTIHVSPTGESASASGSAFAGVQASGSQSISGYGVDNTMTGHVYAGIGARFSATESVSLTNVSVHVGAGVALGVGAGYSDSIKVDPLEIINEIQGLGLE